MSLNQILHESESDLEFFDYLEIGTAVEPLVSAPLTLSDVKAIHLRTLAVIRAEKRDGDPSPAVRPKKQAA